MRPKPIGHVTMWRQIPQGPFVDPNLTEGQKQAEMDGYNQAVKDFGPTPDEFRMLNSIAQNGKKTSFDSRDQ